MKITDRREFLKLSSLTAAAAALGACTPNRSIADPNAAIIPPGDSAYDHSWLTRRTLHRITYGPNQEDLEYATQIGIDNFIDEQLTPNKINDPVVDKLLKKFPTINADPKDLVDIKPDGLPTRELITATLLRAVYSNRQLNEMLVDFWSNHFNIPIASPILKITKPTDDREVIRANALGSFADMLHASAKSPAMLAYLNNADSTKDRPNENYARELLELHTLGVNGGFTQLDVQELARALTGWGTEKRLSLNAGQYLFKREHHDLGEKLILGHRFPAGGGIEEGEQILDMLIEHPSTATYIASKLVRRFVSDTLPASLVTRAAETFTQTRGDISKVMSTILHSPEFKASLGKKLKRPIEVFASTLRITQAKFNPNQRLLDFLVMMGQPLFHWPTPDGYPDNAGAWISTAGTLARWNYALTAAFSRQSPIKINWNNLAGDAQTTAEVIESLSLTLLGESLPPDAYEIVLEFANAIDPEFVLPSIGGLILGSPHFQYR